jgi:hypothetical protein
MRSCQLVNASQQTRANHTDDDIATTEQQEELWMDHYGADSERLTNVNTYICSL